MKKNSIFALGLMALCTLVSCQPAATDNQETKSSTPKGMTLDEALHQRHSVRHYTDQTLTDEQILDLCWAGNGVSHAGNKRTAPSAVNAQDINIYVCKADGAYHYDALKHALVKVSEADVRPLLECQNNFIMQAPLALLLVSDQSNYHTETRNIALGRYVIVSLTFRFGSFGRGRGNRGGGNRGGGMMRGGAGMGGGFGGGFGGGRGPM